MNSFQIAGKRIGQRILKRKTDSGERSDTQTSFALPNGQFADDKGFFRDQFLDFSNGIFIHNHDHANAHVEDTVHFFGGDTAFLLDQLPERRHRPGAETDYGVEIIRQDARDVFDKSAAGEVGKGFDMRSAERGIQEIEIGTMRGEQGIRQGDAQFGKNRIERGIGKYLADEGVSVRVRAAGTQADQHIPSLEFGGARQDICSRSSTPTIVPATSNSPGA